jgi:hypothetical protein
MALACSMCVSFFLTLSLLKNHLDRYHKDDENFQVACQAPGCTKRYDDFEGYKTHLRRKHHDIMHKILDDDPQIELQFAMANRPPNEDVTTPHDDQLLTSDEPNESRLEPHGPQYDVCSEETVRRLNASYLLGTKDMHKLTWN